MIDRRAFLAAAAAVVAAACSKSTTQPGTTTTSAPSATTGPGSTTTPAAATTAVPSTRAPGAPAAFVARGSTSAAGRVALTFHTDGDLRIDQRLLDGIGARGQITCFIVGSWLDANPTWARKLLDAGHELANHTYTHPSFGSLSRTAMASEIARCRDSLIKLTGSGGRFFRPSGTEDGLAVPATAILEEAGKAGYDYVLGWDVDPFDYQDPGGDAIRTRVLGAVKPGAIVSLHFGHSGTADAIPGVLDGLDRLGLKSVTASQLLGL